MKLFKQKSSRCRDKDNKPYTDLYLGWVFNGHTYSVRVCPMFQRDYDKLLALAEEVPTGELVEKYL